MAGKDCHFPPMNSCMVPSGSMIAGPQGGGFQKSAPFLHVLCLKYMVSSSIGMKPLHLVGNKEKQQKPIMVGEFIGLP